MVIQTPPGWGLDQLRQAAQSIGSATPEEYWHDAKPVTGVPAVRRIGVADLRAAIAGGIEDFSANRTDVVFLCVIYPLVGLLLARLASGYDLLPLIFPLASGFALVGPLAAVGLNEMSRRREQEDDGNWLQCCSACCARRRSGRSRCSGWLADCAVPAVADRRAEVIYLVTLGPGKRRHTAAAFAHDVFATGAGWAMILLECGRRVRVLAAAVLAISVVSLPLLLDHNVGHRRRGLDRRCGWSRSIPG